MSTRRGVLTALIGVLLTAAFVTLLVARKPVSHARRTPPEASRQASATPVPEELLGTVRGRIIAGDARPDRFDVRDRIPPDGSEGQQTRLHADGSFEVRRLRPGAKRLYGEWLAGRKRYFVRTPFDIAPGETKDLGDIALGGHAITGRVYFDFESVPPDGWEITLAEKRALVRVTNRGRGGEIFCCLQVPYGEQFELHGLLEGTLSVTCDELLVDGPRVAVVNPPVFEGRVPGTKRVDLPIRVVRAAKVAVRAPVAPEAVRTFFHVVLLRPSGEIVTAGGGRPGNGFLETSGETTSRGEHDLCVLPDPDPRLSEGGAANLVARRRVTIGAGANAFDVALEPGATIRGRMPEGQDGEGALLTMNPNYRRGTWGQSAFEHWLSPGREFVIQGIVPESEWRVLYGWMLAGGATKFRAGAAGSDTWIEVVRQPAR